ncbi:hypothetical protein ACOMHN_030524 [Nucella lapillus]
MFGKNPSLGLTTALPRDFWENITPGISEEDPTDLIVQTGSVDHTDAAPDTNLAVAAPDANSTDVAAAPPEDTNSTDVAAAAPDANSTDQEDLGTSSDRFVSQRLKAVQNLRKQADRMTSRSIAKMKPLGIGDNVLIPVPGCDRGRGDPANLLGVVVDKTLGGFNVGTKAGVLSGNACHPSHSCKNVSS